MYSASYRRKLSYSHTGFSIGEETYAAEGKMELTEEFTWIVDPIDGEQEIYKI